jgi:hypothetical protein
MLTYADVSGEYPVLKIDTAAFIVRKIGQETAMPSAGIKALLSAIKALLRSARRLPCRRQVLRLY